MPHKKAPRFTLALTLSLAFLLASCGGGSSTPAVAEAPDTVTPALFVTASQSVTLNAAGGGVTLAGADGTQYQLVIPAGALTTSTTLTLTTQTPAAGQQFNLLLQPAGLVFASGAVGTLTIQLPAGASLPTTGGVVYDGVLVPFTRLADGQIQVSLSAFASSLPLTARATGEAQPISALKRIAAASSSVCGSAPVLQTNGGLAAVTAVEIELYGQCMVAAVQELAVNEQFVQAVRLAQSVAAYLQATGSGNASQFLSQASSLACLAYRQALDRAIGTSVTDMGTLYAQARPIMFWERTIQALGATCPSVPLTEYQTVIHTKAGEALVYYAQQKPGITATSGAAYARAKAEAIDSQKTRNEVLALNPPPALAATLNAEITQRAQPAVVDALLQAPWLRCRNTGNYDELMSLMESLGSPESVKTAAQYCGTQLSVETLDNQNQPVDSLSGLGGVAAGQTRTSSNIQGTVDGVLRLKGPISALGCPAGVSISEELVIRFAGVEALRLNTAPYLANNLSLNIGQLRAAAGLAASNLSAQPLTIERYGEACAGAWGTAPAPLITVTVSALITCPDGQVLKNGQCVAQLTRWTGEYLDFYDNPVQAVSNVPYLAVLDIVRSSASDDDIQLFLYAGNGSVHTKLRIRGISTSTSLDGQVTSGEICGFYSCSNTDFYNGKQVAWTIGPDGVLSGTLLQRFDPEFVVSYDCPPEGGDCTPVVRPRSRYWQFQFQR